MKIHPGSVVVQVPASTSNLGPGFDTLGIALNLYNRIEVSRAKGRGLRILSALPESARGSATAMFEEAAGLFFRQARRRAFGLEISLTGEVPMARGLGSSVTARLGMVAGLNELTGASWDRPRMLELIAELEHHPDNAAPAVFGGFVVAGMTGRGVRYFRFPISPRLRFVALIPSFEIITERARQLVPSSFSKVDTVHNLNRAALLAAGFASKNYEALEGLFEDRVHQPYRQKLIPELSAVLAAGQKAGAIGGWLSGSGSTIICLTLEGAEKIGQAMRRELPESHLRILQADNQGFKILNR